MMTFVNVVARGGKSRSIYCQDDRVVSCYLQADTLKHIFLISSLNVNCPNSHPMQFHDRLYIVNSCVIGYEVSSKQQYFNM